MPKHLSGHLSKNVSKTHLSQLILLRFSKAMETTIKTTDGLQMTLGLPEDLFILIFR